MAVLTVQNLKMEFLENVLFENADFFIEKNDRVGIVGINGSGKTTLFKLIKGEYEPTEGAVIKSKDAVLGYMQQHACDGSTKTLYDETLEIFRQLIDWETELEIVSKKLMSTQSEELILKQQNLQDMFQSGGGLTYKSKTRSTLLGLGFSESDLQLTCDKLSGGQKSKVSLAKLLLSDANLLLLDEPTNHLDIKSVEWLENYLRDFKGAALIISHDRYFLDKVTTKTLELNHRKMKIFNGSYSKYLKSREEIDAIEKHHYESAMDEIKRVEGIIAQQRQFNREKSIRTAENWEKKLEKMKAELVVPERENDTLNFKLKINHESGDDVLNVRNLSKSFGGKNIFRDVSFEIKKRERVFLIGANGCGKTTLLKILTGEYYSDHGSRIFGVGVDTGYFAQTAENLCPANTVLDEVWNANRNLTQTQIRSALAIFLFKGEEVYKKIENLSGGEKACVSLLKLMLAGNNFLLLDEPTNHLDISSREALEKSLTDYDGTILAVSHDRYFINKLATRIICLDENGIKEFDGNYDDYISFIGDAPAKEKEVKKPKVNEYKLNKERESEKRKLKTKFARLEQEIADTEDEIQKIQEKLNSPEAVSDYEYIMELTEKLNDKNEKLEEMYLQWEEISEKIEE